MIGRFFYLLLDRIRGVNRVRTPTQIQMEAAECGSTSLSIIMAYYKKFVPPSEVRYRCGVSRDGSDAYNILKAAEYYGFEAEGYHATVDELRAEIHFPAIIHWDQNHFVVLEGFHGNWVYINDPNLGPVTLHVDEFAKRYTGIVLSLELTEKFERGGTPPKFFGPLFEKVKGLQRPILAFLFLEIILVILQITFAIFIQIFVDEVMTPPQVTWGMLFLWGFCILVLMNIGVFWLQSYLLYRTQRKISIALSTTFFDHILKLPLSFFQQRYTGEILRRMNLNVGVATFITGKLSKSIVNTAVIVIYLLVIFQYDFLIGILTSCIIIVNIIMLLIANEVRRQNYANSQQVTAQYTGISIDTIQNIESYHLSGSETFALQRLLETNANIVNTFQSIGSKDVIISSFSTFTKTLSVIILMSVGGWRVMYGDLTAGMYVTLQILINNILAPVNDLTSVGMQLPLLRSDLERIDDVLKNSKDPLVIKKDRGDLSHLPKKIEGHISVNNVTFGYQPLGDPIFENISLSIRAGEMIGITGPNGSGKSSLIRLIAGQFPPWEGEILYDDINICKEPLTITTNCVVFVEKEALFVPGTIMENLTLWKPDIKEEELYKACQDTHIHDVILSRKHQYNYVMDEGASDFSEGQRQRLNIARALLHNPTILILDEALNGLEDEIQSEVISNIKRRVKTLVVISHREHVLDLCDRVLTLKNGQLSETKTSGGPL